MALKVLVLNNRVPFPLKDGGAMASNSIIQGLIKAGVEVDLFFLNTNKHAVALSETKNIFKGANQVIQVDIDTNIKLTGALKSFVYGTSYNIERFDVPEAHTILIDLLSKNKYDLIHFETLFVAPYLHTVRSHTTSKCVLRMHNVEYQIWEKLANSSKASLRKTYLSHLAKKLNQYEESIIQKFDALIPISQEVGNWAGQQCNSPNEVIPMGIGVDKIPEVTPGKHFFHIGSMEWLPNKEACEFLVKSVWPLVLMQDKNCHLHLAGKGMDDSFNEWKTANIHIHGEVENSKVFMQAHNAMIIPLKSASGLRIKALEAMSLAKPIISTAIGMSGITYEHLTNCYIANQLDEQVEAIVKLANDDKLYVQLAQNGYNFVANEYDEEQVSNKIIRFYKSLNT